MPKPDFKCYLIQQYISNMDKEEQNMLALWFTLNLERNGKMTQSGKVSSSRQTCESKQLQRMHVCVAERKLFTCLSVELIRR